MTIDDMIKPKIFVNDSFTNIIIFILKSGKWVHVHHKLKKTLGGRQLQSVATELQPQEHPEERRHSQLRIKKKLIFNLSNNFSINSIKTEMTI